MRGVLAAAAWCELVYLAAHVRWHESSTFGWAKFVRGTGLWLSTWLGALAGIAVPFLIQVGCSILMYDAVIWWLVPPSGVLRVIAPLAGVMPDGSPLVRGSAYSQFGLACWLALIVGAIASILLAWLTGRWFNHREAR